MLKLKQAKIVRSSLALLGMCLLTHVTAITPAFATVTECSVDALNQPAQDEASDLVKAAITQVLNAHAIAFDPGSFEITAAARSQHYSIKNSEGQSDGDTSYLDVNASVTTRSGHVLKMNELSLFSSGVHQDKRTDENGEKMGNRCVLDFSKADQRSIVLRDTQSNRVIGRIDNTRAFAVPSLVTVIDDVQSPNNSN